MANPTVYESNSVRLFITADSNISGRCNSTLCFKPGVIVYLNNFYCERMIFADHSVGVHTCCVNAIKKFNVASSYEVTLYGCSY